MRSFEGEIHGAVTFPAPMYHELNSIILEIVSHFDGSAAHQLE